MAHGFGDSLDGMKALELQHVAAINYDVAITGNVVAIADVSGLSVSVRVIDGKYCMNVGSNEISSAKLSTVMKRVEIAFIALVNK